MLPFALAYNSEVITNPSTDHGKDDWNESMMMMSNLKLSNDSKSYTKSRSTIGTHLPGESAASPMHNGKKTNAFQQMQEKFIKSVSARLTVAQVVQNVQSGAELTFDFSVYVLMAAWLAAIGLIENSLVCLVASMLVSPMMVNQIE